MKKWGIMAGLFCLILGYQNCSKINFQDAVQEGSSKAIGLPEEVSDGDSDIGEDPSMPGDSAMPGDSGQPQVVTQPPVRGNANDPILVVDPSVPDNVKDPVVAAPAMPSNPVVVAPPVAGDVPRVRVPERQLPIIKDVENEEAMEASAITTVEQKGFVLICDEDLSEITTIESDAKVVIVNASPRSITKVLKGAEVILVNSQLASINTIEKDAKVVLHNSKLLKYTKNDGQIVNSNSKDEMALWEARCGSYEPEGKSAKEFRTTSIDNDSELDINADEFEVTRISDRAKVRVKTNAFQITNVGMNASLEIH